MQDIQQVFNRLQEAKKRQKEIRSMYTEALKNTPGYSEAVDELKLMRDKKKQIETAVKDSFQKEMIELDDLKIDIASDKELLADIALTQMMQGNSVEIKDKYENEYEPVFSVNFKKIK